MSMVVIACYSQKAWSNITISVTTACVCTDATDRQSHKPAKPLGGWADGSVEMLGDRSLYYSFISLSLSLYPANSRRRPAARRRSHSTAVSTRLSPGIATHQARSLTVNLVETWTILLQLASGGHRARPLWLWRPAGTRWTGHSGHLGCDINYRDTPPKVQVGDANGQLPPADFTTFSCASEIRRHFCTERSQFHALILLETSALY